jgi:hypothetical protein
MTSQKTGTSALGLQKILGLGSYQTAWAWLHKLRRAMVRPGRDRLAGSVEVDQTYWGAAQAGVRGRQTGKKVLIAVAVEQVARRGFGRILMRRAQFLRRHQRKYPFAGIPGGSGMPPMERVASTPYQTGKRPD